MAQNPVTTEPTKTSPARELSPWWVAAGLFGLAFLVRLVYALQINWPPLDDPAYYIQAARSLYHNHNFDLSIIWNFNPRFPNVTHPGLEFWQPLPSFSIFLSYLMLGDNFFATQLPSVVAGALLPPFTYLFARRAGLENSLLVGGLASLFLVFNPLLAYQSALPDSSMLYAALVVGALLLLTRPPHFRLSPRAALIFGFLTGLAYLARTPAIFLVLAWLVILLLQFRTPREKEGETPENRSKKALWLELFFGLLAMAVPVSLWSLRNLLTFGYITSPAGTQTIFLFDYDSLFNYSTPVNLQTWLEGGIGKILGVRLEALWVAWRGVLDAMFVPTVLPAALGLAFLAYKKPASRPAALYTLLLFLGLPLIFGVASTNGTYYHSAGSCAPFLALGLFYGLERFARWLSRRTRMTSSVLFNTLAAAFLLVNLVWLVAGAPGVIQSHKDEGALYGRVRDWLQAHPVQVVIANQPASVNYVSGVAAVRLPGNENLNTLLEVARQYKAGQIIITEQAGRYPELLQSPQNNLFPLAYRSPSGDFEVYTVPEP